jgi:hypothetical protein
MGRTGFSAMKFKLRFVGALLAFAVVTRAQTPPVSVNHDFDFWVGAWEVTTPAGKAAGSSRIERMANGCGLLENWTGAGGFSGKSLNAYNSAKHAWQQFWVGSDGTVLELAGGLDAKGSMVLADATNRITWTPNADGTVRQHWETTKDGGKTWATAFDGLYRKKD